MRIRRCCVYTAEAARHPVLFLVWSAPMLLVRLDWKQNIISLQLWDGHKTRHSTLRGRAGFATLVLVQHPAVRCTASELEVFKLRQTERERGQQWAFCIHDALLTFHTAPPSTHFTCPPPQTTRSPLEWAALPPGPPFPPAPLHSHSIDFAHPKVDLTLSLLQLGLTYLSFLGTHFSSTHHHASGLAGPGVAAGVGLDVKGAWMAGPTCRKLSWLCFSCRVSPSLLHLLAESTAQVLIHR